MEDITQLYSIAVQCRSNAYAPYSKFKVGAAVLSSGGKIFGGCNVENVSYPCGTCAEAGAIAAMIAGGEKQIAEILIVADTENILPCGNCLQKIAEFGTPDTLIHSANLSGNIKTYTLKQLLPDAFAAKEVKNA
ncbi:MAG: cytidine deaminase [Alphaproteobacteria bacterium]|nr:cytidine deaminase [Alphaproteobacteria bacterium]